VQRPAYVVVHESMLRHAGLLAQEPGASVRSVPSADCGVHAWMMGLTCMHFDGSKSYWKIAKDKPINVHRPL